MFFELKIINDLKYTLKSDMALLFYAYNITEELKEKNQMRYVKEMNNIQQCVEEFIKREYIYQ